MIEHLHSITFRHWDCSIRCLGAHALRKLLELDCKEALENTLQRELKELVSLDSVNVHGALVALKEVAEMFEDNDPRNQTVRLCVSNLMSADNSCRFSMPLLAFVPRL